MAAVRSAGLEAVQASTKNARRCDVIGPLHFDNAIGLGPVPTGIGDIRLHAGERAGGRRAGDRFIAGFVVDSMKASVASPLSTRPGRLNGPHRGGFDDVGALVRFAVADTAGEHRAFARHSREDRHPNPCRRVTPSAAPRTCPSGHPVRKLGHPSARRSRAGSRDSPAAPTPEESVPACVFHSGAGPTCPAAKSACMARPTPRCRSSRASARARSPASPPARPPPSAPRTRARPASGRSPTRPSPAAAARASPPAASSACNPAASLAPHLPDHPAPRPRPQEHRLDRRDHPELHRHPRQRQPTPPGRARR